MNIPEVANTITTWIQSPEIVQGTTAGVIASLVFSVLAYLRDHARSFRLRRKLVKTLSRLNAGGGINGLTIIIYNNVGRPFTVRQVLLLATPTNFKLQPTAKID